MEQSFRLTGPNWTFFRETSWLAEKIADMLEASAAILIALSKRINKTQVEKLTKDVRPDRSVLFYTFLILYMGYFALSVILLQTEKSNGIRAVSLMTGSMDPTIIPGALVVTKPFQEYVLGDIVSYKVVDAVTGTEFNKTLTHRIIEVRDKEAGVFVTKGDANEIPDTQYVLNDYILGKVVLNIPYAGLFLWAIKTLPGFIFLIGLPALLLIRNEVKYLLLEIRKGN
jgi:signal peptidase I